MEGLDQAVQMERWNCYTGTQVGQCIGETCLPSSTNTIGSCHFSLRASCQLPIHFILGRLGTSQLLLDIILVLHHEVGEATRNKSLHHDLMDTGTFYLRAVYVPPARVELYGQLEPILLPALDNSAWPIPEIQILEAFRYKLATDFATGMKPLTRSANTHIHWFMPIHIMVDLFPIATEDVRRTTTMYIFQHPSPDLLNDVMDSSWKEKLVVGHDITKCVVYGASIIF